MAGDDGITVDFDDDEPGEIGERGPLDFWVAHDEPERPLGPGVWLCDCKACQLALQASARRNPRYTLMIRTNFDRVAVTSDYLAEVWQRDGGVDGLLYWPDDWVRDIGSATHDLQAPARWWSLCLSEQVGVRRAHRVHVAKYRPLPRRHIVVA